MTCSFIYHVTQFGTNVYCFFGNRLEPCDLQLEEPCRLSPVLAGSSFQLPVGREELASRRTLSGLFYRSRDVEEWGHWSSTRP